MDPTASRHPTAPNCRKRPWDDTDNQAETVDADGLPVASTSQWTAAQVDPTAALAKRLKTTALALPDQELVPFTQFPANDPSAFFSHPYLNHQPDRDMGAMPPTTAPMPSHSVLPPSGLSLAAPSTQSSPKSNTSCPHLPLTMGTADYRAINQLLYQLHQERLRRLGN